MLTSLGALDPVFTLSLECEDWRLHVWNFIFYSYIAIGFLYLPLKNDWIDVDRYMYKGSYLNQDVVIKVLKDEHMKLEFA